MALAKKKTPAKKPVDLKKSPAKRGLVETTEYEYDTDAMMKDMPMMNGRIGEGMCVCCPSHRPGAGRVLMWILTLLNTVLLSIMFFMSDQWYERMEAVKVGGVENYQLVKKLYATDAYKVSQRARIEEMLNQAMMFNPGQNAAVMT